MYKAHTISLSGGPNLDVRGPHGRRMYLFAPDENLGSVGGTETPPTDDETPPSDDKTPSEKPPASSNAPKEDPKWLNDRLARAKESGQKELLKTLGVEKPEDVAEALRRLRELEDAQLTEQERKDKRAKELEDENAELRAIAQRLADENKSKDAESFLKDTIRDAGVDPEAREFVQAKLEKHISGNFGADDEVTAEALEDFFTSLKEKQPFLFGVSEEPVSSGGKKPAPAPAGGKDPAAGPVDVEKMSREEFHAYQRDKYGIG